MSTPKLCPWLTVDNDYSVDDFKRCNDTHGHASGDKVLQAVATRIKNQLRASDIPTRFGGEEFTLLLPQTGSEEANAKVNMVISFGGGQTPGQGQTVGLLYYREG